MDPIGGYMSEDEQNAAYITAVSVTAGAVADTFLGGPTGEGVAISASIRRFLHRMFGGGSSASKGVAKGATKIAQEGGRHSGQLREFLKQTPQQLLRTIKSFDKQIAKHEAWIANPSSKVPNFSQLRPEHQRNLLHHWQQDILRQQEPRSMAQDVLKGL